MRDNSERTPVYQTISGELAELIYGGDLTPGDLLPSEYELCSRYGASRETVRKALKELEIKGLVYSRPRRGYFVCNPHHNEFVVSFSELGKDSTSKYRDISVMAPEPDVAEHMALPPASRVIRIARVSYRDGIPVSFDLKFLPYDKGYPSIESEIHYAMFPEIAEAKATAFDFHTEFEVRAVAADAKTAEALQCSDGEPLLLVCRNFITRDGRHIGYGMHYMRQPYSTLRGVSGYTQEED